MATVLWSAKGGSGTTTVACALALSVAKTYPVVLIDVGGGDVSAVLGLHSTGSVGVDDWASSDASVDALDALLVDGGNNLRVLTSERPLTACPASRWELIGDWVSGRHEAIVIDAGVSSGPRPILRHDQSRSILVTRPCYLSLRRALHFRTAADGLLVIREEGRSLTSSDIEAVLGVPVDAEIPFDPAIARCVDSGLLCGRLPRSLARALRPLVENELQSPGSNDARPDGKQRIFRSRERVTA